MNALICLLAAGLGEPARGPLHCPEPMVAKGDVKGGPALIHSFELTHRGTGTLIVSRVEASCGCLRQSLSASVLQPGETAKLTIEVNTLTQPTGPNRWRVAVSYRVESPGAADQTGEVQLQIAANLTREVSVDPPQVGFSTSGSASQNLVLTDRRTRPLMVLKATSTSPHLSAEIGPRTDAAGGAHSQTIQVKLSNDAPAGHRDETIVLTTDDPAYPELRVPVRVLKRSADSIAAAPERINVRFGSDLTEVSTLVQLRSADGKPANIRSVESDHPGVTTKWTPGGGTVRVIVTETAAAQSGTCKIRIQVGTGDSQVVEIPVAWIAPKRER